MTGEFNGTQDDYEYAERIIRFRNPRFAISISSPLYWDVVYGPNSGTGIYIPMVCMLTHSPTFSNHFGGIGVMAHTAGAGTLVGAGVVLSMLGDIIRAIGAAGMAATGVAGMVVDIGDIIIIGTAVLAGAGAVEAVGLVRLIQTMVRMDKRSYRNSSTVRRYGSSATRSGGSAVRSTGSSSRTSGSAYGRGTSTTRRVVGTRSSDEALWLKYSYPGNSSRLWQYLFSASSTRTSGTGNRFFLFPFFWGEKWAVVEREHLLTIAVVLPLTQQLF